MDEFESHMQPQMIDQLILIRGGKIYWKKRSVDWFSELEQAPRFNDENAGEECRGIDKHYITILGHPYSRRQLLGKRRKRKRTVLNVQGSQVKKKPNGASNISLSFDGRYDVTMYDNQGELILRTFDNLNEAVAFKKSFQ